jgi:hypothetical protein
MWLCQARLLKATVIILTTIAWLAGTNHCLLGSAFEGAPTVTCHCSDHGKASGTQSQTASGMLACCQGLLSPGLELAQTKVKSSPVRLRFQLIALDRLVRFETLLRFGLGAQYETGPPCESSFVATVLKRSLRENAPPFFG